MLDLFQSPQQIMEFRKAIGIGDIFEDTHEALETLNHGLALKNGSSFRKAGLPEDIHEFTKTFESNAAGITDVLQLVGGAALTVQSLDQTMVSLLQTQDHYRFLNTCARVDVANTLLEYNVLRAYRRERQADAFVGEASDPKFSDPVITREVHNIAFMSDAYSISRVLPTVRTTEDPEGVLQTSSINNVLETLAESVWYGNRTLRGLEFDGFEQFMRAENRVLDAEGTLPDVNTIKSLTDDIRAPGFGMANQFWMSVGTKRIWDQYVIENSLERADYTNMQQEGYYIGHNIPGIRDANSKNGRLLFMDDIWLNRHRKNVPQVWDDNTGDYIEGAEGINPPNPPTAATATPSGGPVAGSKWKAGDINGANPVSYRFVMRTDTGRAIASTVVASSGPPVVGEAIDLVITPDAAGPAATFIEIFRETTPGNGVYRYMTSIARNTGGPTTTYQDINTERPGTEIGILGDFNSISASAQSRTYALAQLLPMLLTKYPPGVVSLRKLGGMVELYAGLRVYAPSKFYLVKNLPVS